MRSSAVVLLLVGGIHPGVARAEATDDADVCIDAHANAQSRRNANALLESRALLLTCARESCPNLVRQACTDLLSKVAQQIPTVAVSVVGPTGDAVVDAKVTFDDAPWPSQGVARDVDPGIHEIRVEHRVFGKVSRSITVVEGEKSQSFVVELGRGEPSAGGARAPRSYVPPAGAFVFFGLSIVATGVAATLGGLSLSIEDDLAERAASGPCRPMLCANDEADVSDRDHLAALRVGTDVSLGAAGGLLALGIVVWVVDAASSDAPSTSWITPRVVVGPGMLGGGVSSSF